MATEPGSVVVVGGGVIGWSVAWRLARSGAPVTVIDAGDRGAASTVAAGMLTPVTEAYWGEAALVALTAASLARWPTFAAELEADSAMEVGLDLGGVLVVGVDRDDVAVIDDLHRLHQESDLPSERLSARQLRTVEPLLAPGVAGGAMAPGDGAVDPRKVLAALREAATARGAAHRVGRVSRIHEAHGRVRAVEYVADPAGGLPTHPTDAPTADAAGVPPASADPPGDGPGETIAAGAVVVAAGSWSGLVPGLEAPTAGVRPVFGEVLRLRARDASLVPARTIRAVVRGRHVYIVRRTDGEIVVGATSAERGHDPRVTAGGVYDLLRDARSVVPALDEAEWVEASAGFRPGTPDNAPLIGVVGPTGLVLATGHYRNGILLAPATADAVCDLVGSPMSDRGAADVSLAAVVARACDPGRFGSATSDAVEDPTGTGSE